MRSGTGQRVLPDHKKVGTKLLPPMVHMLPNGLLRSFSYVDDILPNFVWLSALFRRLGDRQAVELSVEFIRASNGALARDDAPPLAYMQNFLKLTDAQLQAIKETTIKCNLRNDLCDAVAHQHALLDRYPLSFLFETTDRSDHDLLIDELSADVEGLLERHGSHSTKVQTTAIVSMMATGKLHISSEIDLPDFNAIFEEPDSAAARRIGSFVRCSINAGAGIQGEGEDVGWARDFWHQAHRLRGCSA